MSVHSAAVENRLQWSGTGGLGRVWAHQRSLFLRRCVSSLTLECVAVSCLNENGGVAGGGKRTDRVALGKVLSSCALVSGLHNENRAATSQRCCEHRNCLSSHRLLTDISEMELNRFVQAGFQVHVSLLNC